jgi:RNA polymerase sigma-70 factor, ECF subfamily
MELTGPAVRPTGVAREQTLSALRERIVAFAASRMAKDAAEDLAQEVLLVIHEKYPHVEQIQDLVPLSLRIFRFKLAGLRRKTHRRGEDTQVQVESLPLAGPDPSPEACAGRKETAERLAAALTRLGPRCKEMFRLKLAGRSFQEIQEWFGAKSINTVYTWDFRCRKQLLESLGGSWEQWS